MNKPLSYQSSVPIYCTKTQKEFSVDPYERYFDRVRRQVFSQYYDLNNLRTHYIYEPIIQYIKQHISTSTTGAICEVGCATGRLLRELSLSYKEADLIGLDYSYQMIKMAQQIHHHSGILELDFSDRGSKNYIIDYHPNQHIHFGMAKAEELPFESEYLETIISVMLWDRLDDHKQFLNEVVRVLRPNGKMILITPENYQKAHHWQQFYPTRKMIQIIESHKLKVIHLNEKINITEPLDNSKNAIIWDCVGLAIKKIS